MHAKKRYQKTQGHRQDFIKVEIVSIGGKTTKAAPKKEAPAKNPTLKKQLLRKCSESSRRQESARGQKGRFEKAGCQEKSVVKFPPIELRMRIKIKN